MYKLVARYRVEGDAAFEPRSRRPHSRPDATPTATADLIIELRRRLTAQGLDAGADTIAWHLEHHHHISVSRATIYRTLAEVRPPYSAGDLAASMAIDKGYVSKVLQALAADRLIEREARREVTDVAWEALIRRIVSSYSLFDSNEISTWVASRGPARLLDDLAGKSARRWAVSGSFAASGLISVTAPATAVIYTDDTRMPEEGEALIKWMKKNESPWRMNGLT